MTNRVGDSTAGGPWFYPSVVSAEPGDTVGLHISADGPCSLTIRRLGAEVTTVSNLDGIDAEVLNIPDRPDMNGCGWPVGFEFAIGDDWTSGYYDLELRDHHGESTRHFVCVRAASDRRADAVLVLNTNTYQSYNYWGGANSYADVDGLQSGRLDGEASLRGAIGRLSRLRPYAQALFDPPAGAPRLVNIDIRPVGELAFPGNREFVKEHRPSAYDGSACFIGKWEHRFVEWAETAGYAIDVITDHDFERADDVLGGYRAAILVGHSEYWSGPQRAQLDAFVEGGGNLAVFSGNTGYWKVRWEDDGDTLIAHKWNGEANDPLWADPSTRGDATHLWSHPAFGRPEAEVTGLSFLYGGYHRIVMCVARGTAAYTVYRDEHWALEGSDLYYGDAFGGDVPLLGYENDGCPIRFDDDGLPSPDGGVGVPENLEIIAFTPATLFEPPRSPFDPVIPPERPEVLAEIAYDRSDDAGIARLSRGHAVMASFRKGDGEVFNAGTTEWAHGLAAGDPFVDRITRNVLDRFMADR